MSPFEDSMEIYQHRHCSQLFAVERRQTIRMFGLFIDLMRRLFNNTWCTILYPKVITARARFSSGRNFSHYTVFVHVRFLPGSHTWSTL